MPSPVMRIAPKPRRFTVRSPPRVKVVDRIALMRKSVAIVAVILAFTINAKEQKQASKRDLKADEKELKRLRQDLKQAQKVGDRRRAQRDRAAISRLEYEIRAERQYLKNSNGRDVRLADRRDTRSWWARHFGRNGA